MVVPGDGLEVSLASAGAPSSVRSLPTAGCCCFPPSLRILLCQPRVRAMGALLGGLVVLRRLALRLPSTPGRAQDSPAAERRQMALVRTNLLQTVVPEKEYPA
jgi:hypothetical protein